jgi:CheY-like chemotaxis protein
MQEQNLEGMVKTEERRALVVDDDRCLSVDDNRVDRAYCVEEALEYLAKRQYSVVFLDMNMPLRKEDANIVPVIGLKLAKEIRTSFPQTKIVCISGTYNSSGEMEQIPKTEVNKFLDRYLTTGNCEKGLPNLGVIVYSLDPYYHFDNVVPSVQMDCEVIAKPFICDAYKLWGVQGHDQLAELRAKIEKGEINHVVVLSDDGVSPYDALDLLFVGLSEKAKQNLNFGVYHVGTKFYDGDKFKQSAQEVLSCKKD